VAHILIVDDQQSVLLTLEALLKSENHLVTACNNAIDALSRLSDEAFDLVISDVVMSASGTGIALLRTIRNQPKFANLPVILLTGKREKEDVEKGIEAGANDYIVKPIDPILLIAKIRNMLTKSDASSQNFAEAAVNVKAEFETKTDILTISELGCVLQSNVNPSVGSLLKVHSEGFQMMGVSTVTLRIVSTEKVATQEGMHKVIGNFVGLSEKELTPLRLWIRGKKRY
jgi:DNA-binding response OmpR family regulator